MKKMNIIKFTAISLLLLAGSANQALADSWTYDKCASRAHTTDWSAANYGTLANAATSYEGWGYNASNNATAIFKWNGEHVISTDKKAIAGQNCATFAQYYLTKKVPSYSKWVHSGTFNLGTASSRLYHGCGLYIFDDTNTADNADLDVTVAQGNNTVGTNYLIKKFWSDNTDGDHVTDSQSKSWTWDNKAGTTDIDCSKYINFVFVVGNGTDADVTTGSEWAAWVESNVKDSLTYYRYITFDTNGGEGTEMAEQTIEGNGKLTANSYTRTGFKFAGWNTKADCLGAVHKDSTVYYATSTNKGPLTLYAQWGVDVNIDTTGTTVYFDKNFIVPQGVEVYGYTYSDGSLVPTAKISAGAILPANKGYLVKTSKAGTYTFITTVADSTAPTSDLAGTTTEIPTPAGKVYVWGKPEGYDYGWYRYIGTTIPGCKAYYIK